MPTTEAERAPFRSFALLAVFLLTAVIFTTHFVADEAEGARAVSRPMLPYPVLGSSVIWTGKEFLIFGGRSGPEYKTTILKFDPESNTVSVMNAKLPTGRQSMAAVYVPGQRAVYIMGGAHLVEVDDPTTGTKQRVPASVSDILKYDVDADKISSFQQLPFTVWGAQATYNERAIHLYGGLTFQFPSTIERRSDIVRVNPFADSASERVRTLSVKLKYPVQDAAVTLLDSRAYIMGGLATLQSSDGGSQSEIVDSIQIFDTRIEDPPTIAPYHLPERVQYAAGAVGDGVAYVIGGMMRNHTPASTISVVRPADQVVTTHPLPIPGARYAAGHGQIGALGDIILVGGRDAVAHKDGLTDIVRFTPGVTEPSPPSALTARVEGVNVALSWGAPKYDGGSAVTHYSITRLVNGFETPLTNASGLTYADGAYPPGSRATYRVRAVNAFGPSLAFAEIDTPTPTRPPSAVPSFTAYAANERVVLRWTAPTDLGGLRLVNYTLYREDADGSRFAAPIAANLTEFVDRSGIVNGAVYTYEIQPFNAAGGGPRTGPAKATPAAVPDAPANLTLETFGNSVTLTWEAAKPSATEYLILRGASATTVGVIASGVAGTTYEDTTVARGSRYHYAVVAKNDEGASPPSIVASAALLEKPGAPRNLQAIAGGTSVRLAWTAPASLGGHTRVVYDVLRTEEGANPFAYYSIDATAFLDQDVRAGKTYEYRVVAVSADDETRGVESAPVTVFTVNKPPEARLATNALHAKIGESVVFDGELSVDPDGRVKAYRFSFNGTSLGKTRTWSSEWQAGPTFTQSFTEEGEYTVSLQVRDDAGAASTIPSVVSIVIGEVIGETNGQPLDGNVNKSPQGGFVKQRANENVTPGVGVLAIVALVSIAAFARRRAR